MTCSARTCVICDRNVVYDLATDVLFSFSETVGSNFSLLGNNQLRMKRMRYTLFGV